MTTWTNYRITTQGLIAQGCSHETNYDKDCYNCFLNDLKQKPVILSTCRFCCAKNLNRSARCTVCGFGECCPNCSWISQGKLYCLTCKHTLKTENQSLCRICKNNIYLPGTPPSDVCVTCGLGDFCNQCFFSKQGDTYCTNCMSISDCFFK